MTHFLFRACIDIFCLPLAIKLATECLSVAATATQHFFFSQLAFSYPSRCFFPRPDVTPTCVLILIDRATTAHRAARTHLLLLRPTSNLSLATHTQRLSSLSSAARRPHNQLAFWPLRKDRPAPNSIRCLCRAFPLCHRNAKFVAKCMHALPARNLSSRAPRAT